MAEAATEAMANVSIAEPKIVANHAKPPGRVRFMFHKLDTDKSGGLSIEELKTGFAADFKLDTLAPHVIEAIDTMFSAHAVAGEDGVKELKAGKFSRFYAEVLFHHFDADNSGTLELAEVQNALKHMVRKNADGEQVMPIIAYPPEFTTESGEERSAAPHPPMPAAHALPVGVPAGRRGRPQHPWRVCPCCLRRCICR